LRHFLHWKWRFLFLFAILAFYLRLKNFICVQHFPINKTGSFFPFFLLFAKRKAPFLLQAVFCALPPERYARSAAFYARSEIFTLAQQHFTLVQEILRSPNATLRSFRKFYARPTPRYARSGNFTLAQRHVTLVQQ
jgi:hypothetical protein